MSQIGVPDHAPSSVLIWNSVIVVTQKLSKPTKSNPSSHSSRLHSPGGC